MASQETTSSAAASASTYVDALDENQDLSRQTCDALPIPDSSLGLLQYSKQRYEKSVIKEATSLESIKSAQTKVDSSSHKDLVDGEDLFEGEDNQNGSPKKGKKKGGKKGGKKKGKKATDTNKPTVTKPGDLKTHPADAFKKCLQKLGASGGECVLGPGIYPIASSETVTGKKGVIRAADGARVYLDGSKELSPKWKPCKNLPKFKDRCANGVWATDISEDIFQLFYADQDADNKPFKREMLVPARWPNNKPKSDVMASDAPDWVSLFDTKKTWSFVKTADHGKDANDKGHGKGWLEDDGGNTRTMHVEVEEDMWEDLTISGDQYLKDANFDATGAVVVVAWGKQMSEQGLVRKHEGNRLEFDKIPCPGGNIVPYRVPPYTSCHSRPFVKLKDGVEQGMLSYFLTQKLELLDAEGEWHFEPKQGGGGTLFVKLKESPKSFRFWGRVGDLAVKFSRSSVEVRDLWFFASRLEAHDCPKMKLFANTFLFPSHSQRTLLNPKEGSSNVPKLFSPESNYLIRVDESEIVGNVFRYSEGKAIDFDGEGVIFKDNLMEYNGWNGIDGPATVKIGRKEKNTVSYNTLRWNGHVSGLFNLAPLSMFEYNRIERQNFGKLQHDGAGIHVVISGQSSTFRYNWIYNGDHSMMIRTDTAKTTELADVGKNGTISYNVGWGGPALVVKGENHTIEHNTVVGPLQIVVSFGAACGMNEISKVKYNAAATVSHRGSCTNSAGKKFDSLPQNNKGNVDKDKLCESLTSCESFDFRPIDASLKKQGGEAGAYAEAATVYFIPGRRLSVPQSPIPEDGAEVKVVKRALIFQPAKDCEKHTIYLGSDKDEVESMTSCQWVFEKPSGCAKKFLKDGANLWTANLASLGKYYWRVQPAEKDCPGAKISPIWSFTRKAR
eukprot:gnl/MRDRNA2_/MRDRNA2_34125_c0_seq1.p1 gnl/MRDRNA2_/MRDRNA2_34125_c0~~gnl/MRDRNA2_/MRDRNA2_34125_c0_seq1.p1  ORF type:complete len:956 (-),score=188.19 gnl/MRDRNA2_/MRDRNA2_34125_c0_seq1:308-3001(-)